MINMARRLSNASDCSGASSPLGGGQHRRDCQLGQLHSVYLDLCKKARACHLLPQCAPTNEQSSVYIDPRCSTVLAPTQQASFNK